MDLNFTLNGVAIDNCEMSDLQKFAKKHELGWIGLTKPSLVGKVKLFLRDNPDKREEAANGKPMKYTSAITDADLKKDLSDNQEGTTEEKADAPATKTKEPMAKKAKAKAQPKKAAKKKAVKKVAVKKVASAKKATTKKAAKAKAPKADKAPKVKTVKPVKVIDEGKAHKLNGITYKDGSGQMKTEKFDRKISDKEKQIMAILIDKKEDYVTRTSILKKIWGKDDYATGRNLDNYINRLRRMFEEADKTVHLNYSRTEGYMLSTKEAKKEK